MTVALLLLKRFWPYLLVAGAVAGGAWWAVGEIREDGYREGAADRDAYWEPQFTKAEKEKAAADARADAIDTASKAIKADLEKSHAETVRDLESRAAASGVRLAGVVRELASCSRREQVPGVAGDDGSDARAAEIDRRAGAIGEALAGVGRDCASDAAVIRDWQRWNERNEALRRQVERLK